MSFSPYTYNGHLFVGAGVELNPPKPFTFSMMIGRLKKARQFDSLAAQGLPPEFERWGYGFKAGYVYSTSEWVKIMFETSMFHAKDVAGSLLYRPDSLLNPGENLVMGVNTQITFAGKIILSAEVASSTISKNILSDLPETKSRGFNRLMGSIIGSNGTTEYYKAMKGNLAYNAGFYSVGIGYERIDPGYETYGTYYFNNDMQNITLNGSLRLFNNRVNIAGNIGRQNDNLDNSKASEMKRWVSAMNIGFSPGEKFSASFSYSTFTSFMNIRSQFLEVNRLTPYDDLDTLNFTQLSSSSSLSLSYVLKNTEKMRQNILLNFNQQRSAEEQNGRDTLGGSTFYNASTSYSLSHIPSGTSFSFMLMSCINNMPGLKTSTFGPSVSLNKLMLNKKLRNSLTLSYNKTWSDGNAQTGVLSTRIGSSYQVGKRHNFNLGLTFMKRNNLKNTDTKSVNEFIANLMYAFSF